MKKLFLITGILVCVLIFWTKEVYAQTTVTLDIAINNAGKEFSRKLKQDNKIAILSMSSSSMRLSKYIIEELTSALVNQRHITVVDRSQLDLLQQEMKFQYSGEVSDDSAQAIGKKLGAQSIITGSFEPLGDYYRFRVKAIEVETAIITITYSVNVKKDKIVASLMNDSGSKQSVSKAKEVKPQVNYRYDFTAGERWGTYILNIFPGFGFGSSIIMKDKAGSSTQAIMELGGLGLIGYGFYSGYTYGLIGGAGLCVINGIYNIVRSATYHKPSSYVGALFDPSALNVVLLPAKDGSIDKVHFSYTLHF